MSVEFRQVLFQFETIKDNNRIGQSKVCRLPSQQRHSLFADSIEIGSVWLGDSTTPVLRTRTCTFGLPIISIPILGEWNYEAASKMKNGRGTK